MYDSDNPSISSSIKRYIHGYILFSRAGVELTISMDTHDSPLVLTKIHLPAFRQRIIPRQRLLDRIESERDKSLILVSAPAGYGKTTILMDWAESLRKDGVSTAWYALDPGDDDPFTFASYLVASISQAIEPATDLVHLAQLLRRSSSVDLQKSIPSIINAVALSERNCLLILDDYHLIGNPSIHSAVSSMIEHLPANLRVAIGSRSDPPLSLARLRARRQLFEVRASDLKFTNNETELFLNQIMQVGLSPEEISALESRTEGWVAGLQLAALSLAGRSDKAGYISSFTGDNRYLVEYLLEEVIDRQPEQIRAFLMDTSILERMCPPLCDAILPRNLQSETILASLFQSNLFLIPLDDHSVWYRYHHLFRDFLQSRLLKTQPQRASTLHQLASEWFAEHKYYREAASHAFQTGDWEYAATFVEQHGFTMIIHSEMALLHEWCSSFPEEVMITHPLLCINQCWGLVFSLQHKNRTKIEQRLQTVEQAVSRMSDQQSAAGLTDFIDVIRSWLSMAPDPNSDPHNHLALSDQMLSTHQAEDAGQFSAILSSSYAHMALHDLQSAITTLEKARQIALSAGLMFGVVESTFHLARLAFYQGKLDHARDLCVQGQQDLASMTGQEIPALGSLDIALGCILFELDQLLDAENHLIRGLERIGIGMNPYYLLAGYLALARLYEVQGRSEKSRECLVNIEENWPDMEFLTTGMQIRLGMLSGQTAQSDLNLADEWCRDHADLFSTDKFLPGVGPFGAAEAYYHARLVWIWLKAHLGDFSSAHDSLSPLLAVSQNHGLVSREIELTLLEAQLAHQENDLSHVLSLLEQALRLGQPCGFIRIYHQSSVLTSLLKMLEVSTVDRSYLHRVLFAIQSTALPDDTARQSPSPALDLVEQLSERELEILRLMSVGATNQAISNQLFITVGTVKSHINHILGKLSSHNRTEAVARARHLHLL